MSLKKVVLIVALAALAMPAAALADGITFGFSGGNVTIARPFLLGSTGTSSGAVTLTYATRMLGNAPFGPATTPTIGTAPVLVWPFTPITNNFGNMSFTTGTVIAANGVTSAMFGAGGSVIITSNSNFATATGGVIASGTQLFNGYFSGPTTMTQLVLGPGLNCNPTVKYCYSLVGPISGNLAPSVLNFFNLGANPGSNGLFVSIVLGFNDTKGFDQVGVIEGGAASVVVPEPGTLALFGTGLIGIAGLIRRRLSA